MSKYLAILLLVGGTSSIAMGGSITLATQNFNTIGTGATANLPSGWKASKSTTAGALGSYAAAVTTTERVDGVSMSTSAANGIYNFGSGTTDTGPDRAVGFLSSGTETKSGNLYFQFVADRALGSIDIDYNVEKYRRGTNSAGFDIELYYSVDGAAWTSAGAAFKTLFAADADNTGYTTAPGVTVPVSGTLDLSVLNLQAGNSLFLNWNYGVTTGTTTTNAQALGIDDVRLSVVPLPAAAWAGMALFGSMAVVRRFKSKASAPA